MARTVVSLFALMAIVSVLAGCSTKEVARSDLPIQSDFSDCEGWATDDSEHIALTCEGGEYRALYKDSSKQITDYMVRRTKTKIDAVRIEAELTFHKTPGTSGERFVAAGLVCMISGFGEPSKGYWFALDAEGNVAILRVDETNEALEDQFYLDPVFDEEVSAVSGLGEGNRVRAECRRSQSGGTDLLMWVNGTKVTETHDPSGVFGYEAFGFSTAATENGTEFRFDDFLAEETPS